MPKYQYKAKDLTGEISEGVIEAGSVGAAREILRERGQYLLDISVLQESRVGKEIEFSSKISIGDLAVFCNQFAVVLKAGVPILRTLEIMQAQTENKKLKKVLVDVFQNIQRGVGITDAFRVHERRFPELFISMLEAGEVSGNLDDAMERMGIALTKEYKLNQKVKNAFVYPMVLSGVAFIVLVFLLVFIVPTFAGLYAESGQQLPALTRMMLSLGDFMKNNLLIIFVILSALVLIIRLLFRKENVRLAVDEKKLKLPVVGGLLLKIVTARFTQSLSTLLASGIPLPVAIEISSRNVGNAFASSKIKALSSEIKAGRGLYEPMLEIGFFPTMVLQMVQLGEASGSLDDLLGKAALFYEDEADNATTRLTALIEPLVIVVMGGLVLLIILSILLPMFGMFSLIV